LNTQSLFDFDGTITSKDTTIFLLVELFKLRPWKFFRLIWFLIRLKVSTNSVTKQKFKNKAIGYMIKDLSEMDLSGVLTNFRNKIEFFYRPSVLESLYQAIDHGHTVLIITASPSFAISFCLTDLQVFVIGTKFEKRENIFTGFLESENCYGQEKVTRINEWATSNKITLSVQSAWGDNLSDFDMLSLSAKRYWVGGEQLRRLIMDRDPEANFVNTEQ
jgi:HAD superfamily hydrolase (TIGR01490 family)